MSRLFSTAAASVLRSSQKTEPLKRKILTFGFDPLEAHAHFVVPKVLQGLFETGVFGKKMMIGLDQGFYEETPELQKLMGSAKEILSKESPGMDLSAGMTGIIDLHVAETMKRGKDLSENLPKEMIRMEAVNVIRNILWQRFVEQNGHQLVPLSKGEAEHKFAQHIDSIKLSSLGSLQQNPEVGRYTSAFRNQVVENILDMAKQDATTIISCVSSVHCAQIAAACKDSRATDSAGALLAAAGYKAIDPFLFVSQSKEGVPVYGSRRHDIAHIIMKDSLEQSPPAVNVTVTTFNATNASETLMAQISEKIGQKKENTTNIAQPKSGERADGRGNDGAQKN